MTLSEAWGWQFLAGVFRNAVGAAFLGFAFVLLGAAVSRKWPWRLRNTLSWWGVGAGIFLGVMLGLTLWAHA